MFKEKRFIYFGESPEASKAETNQEKVKDKRYPEWLAKVAQKLFGLKLEVDGVQKQAQSTAKEAPTEQDKEKPAIKQVAPELLKPKADNIFEELKRISAEDPELKAAREKYQEAYVANGKKHKPGSPELKAYMKALEPYLGNSVVKEHYKTLYKINESETTQSNKKETTKRTPGLIKKAAEAIRTSGDSALIDAWEAYKKVFRENGKDMPNSPEFAKYMEEIAKSSNPILKEYHALLKKMESGKVKPGREPLLKRAVRLIKESGDDQLIAAWEEYKAVYRENKKDMPNSDEFKAFKAQVAKHSQLSDYHSHLEKIQAKG